MISLTNLNVVQVGFALGLMGLAIALSAWQKLGLAANLAIATIRTIVQLLVVGYLLEVVFAINNPWAVLAAIAVMVGTAAVVARNRISQKIPMLLPIVGGAIVSSTALTLVYVNLLVLQPKPWFEPQSLIPLAGILLGNVMNAAAIAGERLVSTLNNSQLEIETHLSLGATPHQATASYQKEAIKAGIIPTLSTMMVVGIVTLPGIITGQILGGSNPLNAALYQILIMFMLAVSTLITTILVIQGVYRRFFNPVAQFISH